MVHACKTALKAMLSWIDPMASCVLEIGVHSTLAVRREQVSTTHATRLLYVSDIHLTPNRLAVLCEQLKEVLQSTSPHLVLLGGDIVDSARAISCLPVLLGVLREHSPLVAAVPGNHDEDAGLQQVARAVRAAGVHWLPDGALHFRPESDRRIVVHASVSAPTHKNCLNILCAHEPQVFCDPRSRNFQLVLAGHYHGGQVILFQRDGQEYPNAWLYPWSGPSFCADGVRLLVSRGVSDSLPIRFNCPREVILCEL